MLRRTLLFPFSAGLLCLLAVSATAADNPATTAAVKPVKANYELAAQWTPTKVGKLVFDLSVTPHWLDAGDRFWYSFENNKGRRFWLVDPVKKSKNSVFDPVKLAAQTLIRKGAALRNYLWIDSQDMAGVWKLALRAATVWVIGVQREALESRSERRRLGRNTYSSVSFEGSLEISSKAVV